MTSLSTPTLRQDAQVISLIGVAHGVSHFFHLILAPLFPWLKEAFSVSYVELGFLISAFFVVSGVGQVLAGFVVDRLGGRNVLFFGLACLGVSALVLSAAQSYPMLVVGSMLAGLGNSVFHPSDFTVLNQRISTPRLGHAYSVHGITGNLGWAAAPIFLIGLTGLFGWRAALFAAAFIPFSVLVVLVIYRDLLKPADIETAVASSNKANAPAGDLLGFLRLPGVWMCFAFFIITAVALSGVQSFSSPSLQATYGMSISLATTAFTAYMLTSAAGMIWGGFLTAKTTRHERTIAISFMCAGLMALVIASGTVPPWMAVVLMGAVGFGAGVAGPSRDLLIKAAAPKNATGRVYGVVYSGLDVGFSVAPLLFGLLMDAGHPAGVFVLIGLFQILAIGTAVGVSSSNARAAGQVQAA